MVDKKEGFTGFYPETFAFLIELGMNNYRTWFDEHRADYQNNLLEPMQKLVSALADTMLSIDENYEVAPRVDKTISRIYRDTRFSKDKSPFRNNMWISFKRPGSNWQGRPTFFFEIMPDAYRFGLGYYAAAPATMKKFRKIVDSSPTAFRQAIKPIGDYFTVKGENYKKPFCGERPAIIDRYYNKKSFYLMHKREPDELIFSAALASEIAGGFRRLKPLYLFLSELIHGEV